MDLDKLEREVRELREFKRRWEPMLVKVSEMLAVPEPDLNAAATAAAVEPEPPRRRRVQTNTPTPLEAAADTT